MQTTCKPAQPNRQEVLAKLERCVMCGILRPDYAVGWELRYMAGTHYAMALCEACLGREAAQ